MPAPSPTVKSSKRKFVLSGPARLVLRWRVSSAASRFGLLCSKVAVCRRIVQPRRLYAGKSTGLPYFPLDAARLRMFGGTTNHWGATCRPFSPFDFEARDWIPHSGWPIQKDEVQPYYDRARAICWVGSPDWNLADWEQRDGLPILPLEGGRVGSRVAQVVPAAERSFAKHYRDDLDHAPNVTTYLNANVTEIVTNDAANTVTDVRVACLSGNQFSVKAGRFILAAGGMENPRILLYSNRQQTAGLGNQNDLVGRFFMEHPRLEAGVIVPADRHLEVGFYKTHSVSNTRLLGYLGLTEETIRKEKLVDIQVRMTPVYSAAYRESHKTPEVASLQYLVQKLRRRELPDDFGTHVSNIVGDLLTAQDSFLTDRAAAGAETAGVAQAVGRESGRAGASASDAFRRHRVCGK